MRLKRMKNTQKNKGFLAARILAGVGAAALLSSGIVAGANLVKQRKAKRKSAKRARKKGRAGSRGFSLAEVLLAVGIIIVLAALAVVGLTRYRRSLHQLQMDATAKEIFIAAQNHLTLAESQGYLGMKADSGAYGTEEKITKDGVETGTGVYYFIVGTGTGTYKDPDDAKDTLLSLMLPFAAVDETARLGGSYVIRYHAETATVMDVFYAEKNGSFAYTFDNDIGKYNQLLDDTASDGLYGAEKRTNRAHAYGKDSVIGWYGGVEASSPPVLEELPTPWLEYINGDVLLARVHVPKKDSIPLTNMNVQLFLAGETSGSRRVAVQEGDPVEVAGEYVFTYILDDVTVSGKDFYNQYCSDATDTSRNLLPGENIVLSAKVSAKDALATPKESVGSFTTNSLFGDNSDPLNSSAGTANITSIRHLQNLDESESHFAIASAASLTATQTADLTWDGFRSQDSGKADKIGDPDYAYKAVDTVSYSMTYKGYTGDYTGQQVHSITGVPVTANTNAGIFGLLDPADSVLGLELIDITAEDTNHGSSGALAGTSAGNVTGVLARHSAGNEARGITSAEGAAGGLIGTMTGGTVEQCGAALVVSGGSYAGGLVGNVTDGSIIASYAGGHTTNAKYSDTAFNVTATAENGIAGGLVGSFTGVRIENSYSTCSAASTAVGGVAGGLAGKLELTVSSAKVDNCYATGLVSGSSKEGAFAGTMSLSAGTTVTNCRYYEIINERDANGLPKTDANYGKTGYAYLGAVNGADHGGITPLDATAATYNGFVKSGSARGEAFPYDSTLSDYYKGYYILPTAAQLNGGGTYAAARAHYGDWPAPEVWVVNP